jgi:hypothetical protein
VVADELFGPFSRALDPIGSLSPDGGRSPRWQHRNVDGSGEHPRDGSHPRSWETTARGGPFEVLFEPMPLEPASVGIPDIGTVVGTRSGFAAYDDGPSGLESSRRFEPNQREATRSRAGEVGARFGGYGPNQRGATRSRAGEVGARFGGYGPNQREATRSRAGKSVLASVGTGQPARGQGLELGRQ